MSPAVLKRLGEFSVRRFLRDYWQRRPLLLRAALGESRAAPTRDRLFELAGDPQVESRLVRRRGAHWSLRHGPFARRSLPALREPGWTLLVQGADLVDAQAHALLSRFRFVPDARLDDLMVSYASHGGGVGPHVDNYDVFLLQTAGRRRWRISRQRGLATRAGQPLPLLRGFRPTREWVLEPGDLLYLPPGVAHEGVAIGESVTCSIGFRTPTWAELLDPWLARFAAHATLPGRYADPGLRPARHPAALPATMVRQAHAALSRARPSLADTRAFLLEHLSEPKPHVIFDQPRRLPSLAAFQREAGRRGLALDPRSRMLSAAGMLAINGEPFSPPARDAQCLRRLADQRRLAGQEIIRMTAAGRRLLREWFAAGWLRFEAKGQSGGDGLVGR